ncbi:MAG: YbhB/YbcL family Raf kinase inhibitor-like protein [Streptosporangiaceae bacterium]
MGRYGGFAAVAAGVLAVSLLNGCGVKGGPKALLDETTETMTVTSPMVDQRVMSSQYTCDGTRQSPPIFWSGMPPGTKSLALVVDDAAAPITPRVYWIVFDISPVTTDLQAGAADQQAGSALPSGARQARNSTGRVGYDPPCPPAGGSHRYRFTVYALSAMLDLPDGVAMKAAWVAIAPLVIARGRLTVTAPS